MLNLHNFYLEEHAKPGKTFILNNIIYTIYNIDASNIYYGNKSTDFSFGQIDSILEKDISFFVDNKIIFYGEESISDKDLNTKPYIINNQKRNLNVEWSKKIFDNNYDSFKKEFIDFAESAGVNGDVNIVNGNIYLILKFDEVKITNTVRTNESFIIRDLYIYTTLDENFKFKIRQIYGMRGTVSYQEYMSKYSHSHLPSNPYNSTISSSFCIGSSGISNILNTTEVFTINTIPKYIIACITLAITESQTGGPHMYVKNIHWQNSNVEDIDLITCLSKLKQEITDNGYSSFNANVVDTSDKGVIKFTVDANTWMDKTGVGTYLQGISSNYCSYDKPSKEIIDNTIRSANSNLKENISTILYFKGEQIITQIEDYTDAINGESIADVNVKSKINEFLSSKIKIKNI